MTEFSFLGEQLTL